MSITLGRPFLTGSFSTSLFFFNYYSRLRELSIGEFIEVNGFSNKSDLRNFTRLILKNLPDSDRKYEFKINEKDLTYIVGRVE